MAIAGRVLLPRAERQETILHGAAKAFASVGFAGTSLDEVATAAGITKPIIYRHFDSKEDLYIAVLTRASERLVEEFLASVNRDQWSDVGVRTLLTVAREDPDAFTLLWRHASREPQFADSAREHQDLAHQASSAFLGRLIDDPLLLAWASRTMVAYLVDAVLIWLEEGSPGRDEEFIERVTRSLPGIVGGWVGAPTAEVASVVEGLTDDA